MRGRTICGHYVAYTDIDSLFDVMFFTLLFAPNGMQNTRYPNAPALVVDAYGDHGLACHHCFLGNYCEGGMPVKWLVRQAESPRNKGIDPQDRCRLDLVLYGRIANMGALCSSLPVANRRAVSMDGLNAAVVVQWPAPLWDKHGQPVGSDLDRVLDQQIANERHCPRRYTGVRGFGLGDGLQRLLDLQFADDILRFTKSKAEARYTLDLLIAVLGEIGFILIAEKTVIITTEAQQPPQHAV
ncbi:hypothetical protein AK812_SmicGene7066 [Symbiodinium microadriaticum]|uniref:Reverse transcriptase domain-containing protein n=1 Tax=Symbiodinium microadriaticum TaxID=2951 RepID=A0A1Q9EPR1_SYMMI|nr:hypothetical protein AK812_SmicGene7066 [Symbiodinium microadriaticum]CAE7701224.1 unnamed protein product [Symbiodinium sp. KB8]